MKLKIYGTKIQVEICTTLFITVNLKRKICLKDIQNHGKQNHGSQDFDPLGWVENHYFWKSQNG